jgi:hypothetical protein
MEPRRHKNWDDSFPASTTNSSPLARRYAMTTTSRVSIRVAGHEFNRSGKFSDPSALVLRPLTEKLFRSMNLVDPPTDYSPLLASGS